jgi:hypothetical protein
MLDRTLHGARALLFAVILGDVERHGYHDDQSFDDLLPAA